MFNEESNIHAFVAAVLEVMDEQVGETFEVILVDDGSSDGTWNQIQQIASTDKRIRGLALSRNFGHQAALFAGLHHAAGRAVISMDGDLQHPPSLIPAMLAAWRGGYDIVVTRRTDDRSTTAFKRWTSRTFYRCFSLVTGVAMSPGSSDFRLVDSKVLDSMLQMQDTDLFLRGLVSWLGFQTTTLPYQAAERFSGTSKYNLRRMLRFAAGAMVSFSMLPLRLGIWAGFFTSLLALAEIAYIIVQYFRGETVPGWASLMTVMSMMFAILFVLLGIIGAYVGKIYEILKGRPRFVIGRRVGFGPHDFVAASPEVGRPHIEPPMPPGST